MVANVSAGPGYGTTTWDGSGDDSGVHVKVLVNKGISSLRSGMRSRFGLGAFGMNPFGLWPY
jgi:hypothetical protein